MIFNNRKNDYDFVIVTHLSPDLDAIMAVWLLKKFVYKNEKNEIEFVPIGKKIDLKSKKEIIYVDTSGGKFDHHNSDKYICSSSLVMEEYLLYKDDAIKRMVNYALEVDHGKNLEKEISDFDIINVIGGLNFKYKYNPKLVVELSMKFLDAIYDSLNQKIKAEKILKNAITFNTKWGKGLGVISTTSKTRYLAHRRGYKVYVNVDPKHGYRSFQSPGNSNVDFSEIFEEVKKLEPKADWFLHSSKQLLLCGSSKAPDRNLSTLSLDQLIDLVRI